MNRPEIKSICLYNDKSDEGVAFFYGVGYKEVTKIDEALSDQIWCVYAGDKLIAKVYTVDEIMYK